MIDKSGRFTQEDLDKLTFELFLVDMARPPYDKWTKSQRDKKVKELRDRWKMITGNELAGPGDRL